MARTVRWCSEILLLVGAFVCCRGGAEALTLEQALVLALKHDAAHQAEGFAAQAEHAEGLANIAAYGPRLSAQASALASRDRLDYDEAGQNDATDNFGESEWRLSFNQPLFDAERFAIARRGAVGLEIARLLGGKADEDLVLRLREQFYTALAAKARLSTAESEHQALQRLTAEAEEKLTTGAGVVTDRDLAESRALAAAAQAIAARIDYENAAKVLAETIGQDYSSNASDAPEEPCPNCPLPHPGENFDHWREQALRLNSALALARLRYQEARQALRERQGRFLPALSLFSDYSRRDSDGGLPGYGDQRQEFDIGLRLSVDFLAGGGDAAQVLAAARRRDEARARLDQAERGLLRALSSLWDSLRDSKALVEAREKAVGASERALASTRMAYDEGIKTQTELLDAQREYFQAIGHFRVARYDYLTLYARFDQTVGGFKPTLPQPPPVTPTHTNIEH
ncbi:MAG: TolC family protein [Desulfobulbaceae bacterium]|jgi:outer membrane protein|nr:TolC family protein [Desulfobulbaceae bacterium]